MNNSDFLQVIKESFLTCLSTSERSTAKLKILHGSIAKDIATKLKDPQYKILSQGYGCGKECKILGRYIDKLVDITILKDDSPIAGIAVKFVMSNYSQNSNNYFENMLGETANIRSANIPYFQIFIIPDKLPYYEKDGTLSRWEHISENNLSKYLKLSKDNVDMFMHTPNKTLVYIVHITENDNVSTKQEYKDYYLNNDFSVKQSDRTFAFGNSIVYNDYETFAKKVSHAILSV